jgi:type I restriction-modification system DNA methylase subunit
MSTTDIIRPYLEACGYKPDCIKSDYVYSDGKGNIHKVGLAAFANRAFDYRSSCIGVVDGTSVTNDKYDSLMKGTRGLGAPVVFSCFENKVDWWLVTSQGLDLRDEIPYRKLGSFFDKDRKAELSPSRIEQAKNLSRYDKQYQLSFDFDYDLIPVLEKEMGECLAGLIKAVTDLLFKEAFTGQASQKEQNVKWVIRSSFWLLCGKVLHDKQVDKFKRINPEDVDQIIDRVNKHYGCESTLEFTTNTKQQKNALQKAAKIVFKHPPLSNITTESFSYIYEKVFVTPAIRKAFGVHATPSYLVDYIVWPLMPLVQSIPQEERFVFEPTCGHAPFLTSAMRMLRELYEGEQANLHDYLKRHLVGVEKDPFAKEIARLSLTIADVPNPNGWDLIEKDAYEDETLSEIAKRTNILLCNPPFEDFKEGKEDYSSLKSCNKAAEVLLRTLPFMPDGSVFGVILPRVFLHGKPYNDLRKYILEQFSILEISLLPENVFAYGKHKSIMLAGRKSVNRKNIITYNNIPKHRLVQFRERYGAETEHIPQERFLANVGHDLRIIPLEVIWNYCKKEFGSLQSVAVVGRGIEYKKVEKSTSLESVKGWHQGYAKFQRTCEDRHGKRKKHNLRLTDLPDLYWMDVSQEAIENPRYGMERVPQVLLNYARTSDGPWRLKALNDTEGRPVTNRFLTVRPKSTQTSINYLWALLNSPIANAYVYCYSMERDNLETTVRSIPLPIARSENSKYISTLVDEYVKFVKKSKEPFHPQIDENKAKMMLLRIDAEVLKLYDLPPKYEKKVLDLFSGWSRNGVDFDFQSYYPEGFESYIPLHEYISEEYQRSTAKYVSKWVENNRSEEVIKAFEIADEAFRDE